MTIYILDQDPAKSAQMLDDKSLDKQIKEIAQVLCNVCYWQLTYGHYENKPYKLLKKDVPLKPIAIPAYLFKWSKWIQECKANYLWMIEYGLECSNEWTWRNHLSQMMEPQFHKSHKVIEWAADNIPNLRPKCVSCDDGFFEPGLIQCQKCWSDRSVDIPLVMPKKYQIGLVYKDNNVTIQSYRNYYQAKLSRKIKSCCIFTNAERCLACLSSGGYYYDLEWTNRQKPDWLRI